MKVTSLEAMPLLPKRTASCPKFQQALLIDPSAPKSGHLFQIIRRPTLFGRCLLRFQAFQLLTKSMLEGHFVSGSIARPEDALTRQIDDTRLKTMGLLVGDLMGSHLVPAEQEGSPDVIEEASGFSFAIRLQIALPFEVLARIETEHRALVALRNSLVHHFLEEHDLGSEAGIAPGNSSFSFERPMAAAMDGIAPAC